MAHDDVGRRLLLGLKYRNARAVARPLAERMALLVDPLTIDVVTWAPTSAARRRRRGYDQGELLARSVARTMSRPCRPLLRRLPSPPQTGRSRTQRLLGPQFVARPLRRRLRVLVVDDVVTTGATLKAAASALRSAGADAVWCIAGAATP